MIGIEREQDRHEEMEGETRQPVAGACGATKADGERCQLPAQPNGYCWSHDPANAEQRARNASAGGKAVMSMVSEKSSAQREEIAEIKGQLRALASELKDGSVPPQTGGVIVQVFNALLRAIEQDRRVRELDEIEARVSDLEGLRS